jgi:hypothetical protein
MRPKPYLRRIISHRHCLPNEEGLYEQQITLFMEFDLYNLQVQPLLVVVLVFVPHLPSPVGGGKLLLPCLKHEDNLFQEHFYGGKSSIMSSCRREMCRRRTAAEAERIVESRASLSFALALANS